MLMSIEKLPFGYLYIEKLENEIHELRNELEKQQSSAPQK
jgi:hypothetical protein